MKYQPFKVNLRRNQAKRKFIHHVGYSSWRSLRGRSPGHYRANPKLLTEILWRHFYWINIGKKPPIRKLIRQKKSVWDCRTAFQRWFQSPVTRLGLHLIWNGHSPRAFQTLRNLSDRVSLAIPTPPVSANIKNKKRRNHLQIYILLSPPSPIFCATVSQIVLCNKAESRLFLANPSSNESWEVFCLRGGGIAKNVMRCGFCLSLKSGMISEWLIPATHCFQPTYT